MLGRGVGEFLSAQPAHALFGGRLLEIVRSTDGMLLNLECCISERGEPWPGRTFHFRAPPAAIDALQLLGVHCGSLANNHALDFGTDALLDTIGYLQQVGIAFVGAGRNETEARAPATFAVAGERVSVPSFADHPSEYAATETRPGTAYVDLEGQQRSGAEQLPDWITAALATTTGLTIASPHWGPNMIEEPLMYVRRAAHALVLAGADMVAGHSAHVFHGVEGNVLYDLGDFIDDYATGPLRNDLGLLWILEFERGGPRSVEAVPIRLGYCHTDVADGSDAAWIRKRLHTASQALREQAG